MVGNVGFWVAIVTLITNIIWTGNSNNLLKWQYLLVTLLFLSLCKEVIDLTLCSSNLNDRTSDFFSDHIGTLILKGTDTEKSDLKELNY